MKNRTKLLFFAIIISQLLISSYTPMYQSETTRKPIILEELDSSNDIERNIDFTIPSAYLSNQTINVDFIYPIDKVTVTVTNTTNYSIIHSQVYYNTSFIQFNINMIAGDEYELNIIHDKWELSGYFEL